MRRFALVVAIVLVAAPSAALAAKPSHPATPANGHANGNANPTSSTGTSSKARSNGQSAKVMYVLHGKFGTYNPVNGSTNGSIAITVSRSNHGSALKNATLTFAVGSTTKLVGTVTSGHNGIVKVRAAKNASSSTLQTLTAVQVIDRGAA